MLLTAFVFFTAHETSRPNSGPLLGPTHTLHDTMRHFVEYRDSPEKTYETIHRGVWLAFYTCFLGRICTAGSWFNYQHPSENFLALRVQYEAF